MRNELKARPPLQSSPYDMHSFLVALNSFWEDSSVLVVVAYLLTRGRFLTFVFPKDSPARGKRSWGNILLSGCLLGAVGATEYLFPNLRYPYATPTLFITFATFACGLPVGGVTAAIVLIGALAARTPLFPLVVTAAASISSLIIGGVSRRFNGATAPSGNGRRRKAGNREAARNPRSLLLASLTGMAAEAVALGLRGLIVSLAHPPFPQAWYVTYPLVSVPANGVGMALLQLIVREAWQRADTDRLRREAAAARAFAAQQQLTALRARVHPHFLFNTLNSIASLCAVAPERAETAAVKLGEVMRRALEAPPHGLAALGDEIDDARAFIDIEKYRYEERLNLIWRVSPGAEAVRVPPFALATLIDNAINHGIAAQRAGGNIMVTIRPVKNARKNAKRNDRPVRVRRQSDFLLVVVRDDGVGMSADARKRALSADALETRPHGLALLDRQLRLHFGPLSRLRLFSQLGRGTLAAFAVPLHAPQTALSVSVPIGFDNE